MSTANSLDIDANTVPVTFEMGDSWELGTISQIKGVDLRRSSDQFGIEFRRRSHAPRWNQPPSQIPGEWP